MRFEKSRQGPRRARQGLRRTAKAGEDEDTDGEEGDEQTELLVAAMERVSERLEPGGMACQLEDAEDPHDAEDLDHPACVVHLGGRQSSGLGQRQ